jgi:peptide/nickel transport system ATP-binding protein
MTGTAAARITALRARTADRMLLDEVSFELHPGQVTALTGPSGSGKTTTALALIGESGPNVRLSGRVGVAGHLVLDDESAPDELAAARDLVRGHLVAFLPQHADQALNPTRRVGAVLTEIARVHHPGAGRSRRAQVVGEALDAAQLPADAELLRRFPHQFSGGQRQRLVLAQTILCAPAVLVLDEPTTGLDPDTARHLVRDLAGLAATGMAILLLSHDMDVVRALADDTLTLREGRLYRSAMTGPANPPVRPHRPPRPAPVLVAAEAITATHRVDGRPRAVLHRLDLRIGVGECVGVVGPSGSGKTTLARCLAGLHPFDSGQVLFRGSPLPVLRRRGADQRRRIQYVWQDVAGSFDPSRPVLDQVARTAQRLRGLTRAESRHEAETCLARLHLAPATARHRPGELSGGELRRAALARALLAEPDLLICDEITSSLDADRATLVLDLLDDIRCTTGTALLLISHDRPGLATIAERVVTLDRGTLANGPGPEPRCVAGTLRPG